VEALSEREVEVLRLVAAGLANRAIGQRLFITEKTVKKHLSNILGKLGATNRTQAVDQARRLGLV
jgi:DNA-binding NarL/FixJ family response regulator